MKIVDRIFNTVLTADDSSAQEELGSFRFEDGNIYKYVQFQDTITAALGGPVLLDGTSSYKVTVDVGSGAGVGGVIGVALTTNTPEYYGWIQTYGVATVRTTDALSAGDHLIVSGTDNSWVKGLHTYTSEQAVVITAFKSGAVVLETYNTAAITTLTAFIRCM